MVVDARCIAAPQAGIARYGISIVPRLIALRPDWRWTVLRHTSSDIDLDLPLSVMQLWSQVPIDSLRNHLFGPRVRVPRADVYHSLFQVVPPRVRADRIVVTAHDFIDMDHSGEVRDDPIAAAALGVYADLAFRGAMRAADSVVAISEPTAVRARQLTDAPVEVVWHGVEPRYFEPPPSPDRIVDWLRRDGRRYVVAIGNDKPYKNLATAVRALPHAPGLDLALVGNCDGLRPLVEALRLDDRVAFLGHLGDTDLRRVLGQATAFVFPSLLEGFGMPPLEAMALGIPTLVADVEPMRSICSDAALRFEPTDVIALAELILQVASNDHLAGTLGTRGRIRARQFDWDACAEKTLAFY